MNPQHFLFCASNDCLKFNPENNSHDFLVELPQTLHLEGEWECALVELLCDTLNLEQLKVVVLMSDLCSSSYIDYQRLPVLRRFLLSRGSIPITTPFYVPLTRDQIQRFRIDLSYGELINSTLPIKTLYCTLHLRRCPGSHLSLT